MNVHSAAKVLFVHAVMPLALAAFLLLGSPCYTTPTQCDTCQCQPMQAWSIGNGKPTMALRVYDPKTGMSGAWADNCANADVRSPNCAFPTKTCNLTDSPYGLFTVDADRLCKNQGANETAEFSFNTTQSGTLLKPSVLRLSCQ
jgi:hypothetical protein